MKKIILNDESYLNKFVSIFGIGILECIKSETISFDDAWDWLFNTHNIKELKHLSCSRKIVKAIDLGTELEFISDEIPNELEKSLNEIKSIFINEIKKKQKVNLDIDNLLTFIQDD